MYDKHFPIILGVLLDWDVFVCLTTGYGSHFVKPFLPWAFDARWRKDNERRQALFGNFWSFLLSR